MWMWKGWSTMPGGSVFITAGRVGGAAGLGGGAASWMPPLTVLLMIFHSSTVLSMMTSPTLPSNLCPLTVCVVNGLPLMSGFGVDWNTTVLVPVTSESLMSCRNGGNAVFIGPGGMNCA